MASDDDKKKSNPNTKTITTTTTEEEEKTPATTDAAKSDDKDTKKKDVEEAQVEVEAPEAEEVVKEETAIEAKAAEATDDEEDGNNNDNQTMPDTPSNKRRFFPRVKHLLTREWEYFLSGVLESMEQAGASTAAAASHKASNPWFKAFDLVYGGVASDCSIPTGKNRYHKFKDKIVELWLAMEQQAPDDHPLKAKAMEQLETYRKACEQANKKETTKSPSSPSKGGGGPVLPLQKNTTATALPAAAAMTNGTTTTMTSNKRSYVSTYSGSVLKWKHLNEASALERLPQPLQSLVHLRHLGAELGKKSEDAETQYLKALEEYCKQTSEDKDVLYAKSLALAALYRQAQDPKETKDITQAYEKTVEEYLVQIDPSAAVV